MLDFRRVVKNRKIQPEAAFCPTKNQGLEWMNSNPRMQIAKMTRDDFCSLSKVSKTALREFELGKANIRRETANKILAAFEVMGIRFNADGTFSHGQSTPRD